MKNFVIFVSGIGTDVGKTVTSAAICLALEADYWKPIQSGMARDCEIVDNLMRFYKHENFRIYPSVYEFKESVSPHKAARMENREIDLDSVILPELEGRSLVIEGAGGLLSPLNDDKLTVDLIVKIRNDCLNNQNFKIVLVSRNYLGSINHTLLSFESLKSRGLDIDGIVFFGSPEDNQEFILRKTGTKSLGNIDSLNLVDIASRFRTLI